MSSRFDWNPAPLARAFSLAYGWPRRPVAPALRAALRQSQIEFGLRQHRFNVIFACLAAVFAFPLVSFQSNRQLYEMYAIVIGVAVVVWLLTKITSRSYGSTIVGLTVAAASAGLGSGAIGGLVVDPRYGTIAAGFSAAMLIFGMGVTRLLPPQSLSFCLGWFIGHAVFVGTLWETPLYTICLVAASVGMLIDGFRSFSDHVELLDAQHRLGSTKAMTDSLLARFEAKEAGWTWEVDPQGRLTGNLDGLARALGRNCDRIAEAPLVGLMLPGHPGAQALNTVLVNHEAFDSVVVQARRADSEKRVWELGGQPMIDATDGKYLGHRGIGVDLSNHEHLRVMQERERRMESFAAGGAGLAHDINGMLQASLSSIELHLLEESRRVAPEGRPSARRLHDSMSSIQQAASIADELVAYNGRQAMFPAPVLFTEVLQEALEVAPPKLDLVVDIEPDLTVLADRALLLRSVGNLLRNSHDTAGDDGVRRVAIRAERQADGMTKLTIGDDGPGYPEGEEDKLLEPFFTTRRGEGGTGIGLSMVNGFVLQSGGRLELGRSDLGGAETVITLPAGGPPALAAEPEGEMPTNISVPAGIRMLLVEDDSQARAAVAKAVAALGVEVVAVSSVTSARQAIEDDDEGPYDVLLSDMMLPDGMGIDVAALLGPEVPAVWMTGFRADSLIGEGPVPLAVLKKPFRLQQLVDVLGRATSRSGSPTRPR